MSALARKLRRELWRLKGQVLTTSLVVACGIASFIALRATYESLLLSRDTYYDRSRFADVFAAVKQAPDSVLPRVQAIPGVSAISARIVKPIKIPLPTLANPASGNLVSLPAGEPLNAIVLRTGRHPAPERRHEVVVLESFASAHGLEVGDRIPVIVNGAMRSLEIVGTALAAEYIFPARPGDFAGDAAQFAVLWMDHQVLAADFRMVGAWNDLSVRLKPDADAIGVTRDLDLVLAAYGGYGAQTRDKQASNYILAGELKQLSQFATTIPLIFLAVAALLVNIVLSRLVYLQRQEIAVLKALGYSNFAVGTHFLALVWVVVSLGAVLGIAFGVYAGRWLTSVYAGFFQFPNLEFRISGATYLAATLVSLAAATIGCLSSVARVVRMPPAEAMRPPAPLSFRTGLLDRLRLSRWLGPATMMVLRELLRRPIRSTLSSLGIAAGIGIIVVGRFGYDAFDYLIEGPLHEENRGHLTAGFAAPVPESSLSSLRAVRGVLDVEGVRVAPVRLSKGHRFRDTMILGLPEAPRLRFVVDRTGHKVSIDPDGFMVSRMLANVLDVRVGDKVELETREGRRVHAWVSVTGFVDDAFGLQIYVAQSYLHRLLNEEPSVSMAYLRIDPDQRAAVQMELTRLPAVVTVTDKDRLIERFREQSGSYMWVMTLVLTLFGATIAIGVVYNNARVALSLRGRDLASLRVLGFTRAEISSILLGELFVQLVVAVPLGLWFGGAWVQAIMASADPETYRMPLIVSARTYAFAAFVAVGAAVVSGLLVRRKLDRLDLIAVLKTRES